MFLTIFKLFNPELWDVISNTWTQFPCCMITQVFFFFCLPTLRLWAYLIKVIPEMCHAHILYIRFYFVNLFDLHLNIWCIAGIFFISQYFQCRWSCRLFNCHFFLFIIGRPFVVEMVNPRKVSISEEDILQLQQVKNLFLIKLSLCSMPTDFYCCFQDGQNGTNTQYIQFSFTFLLKFLACSFQLGLALLLWFLRWTRFKGPIPKMITFFYF